MYRILHWKYWMEIVRLATFIVVTALLIFAVAAYSSNQHKQAELLQKISDQNATIKSQNATIASLSKQIKSETDSIHDQATCIFLFFAQPQTARDNTSVTYPPSCVTSTGSSPPKVPGSLWPLNPAALPQPLHRTPLLGRAHLLSTQQSLLYRPWKGSYDIRPFMVAFPTLGRNGRTRQQGL